MATKQNTDSGASNDTRTIVTVILLIFIFPIGFLMMWFWSKWKLWVKLLISVPIFLIFSILFTAGFIVAFNPRAQFKRAECVKECKANNPTATDCIKKCAVENQTNSTSYPAEAREAFVKNCLIDFTQEECDCAFDHIERNLPYKDYLEVDEINDNTPQDDIRVKVLNEADVKCEAAK